MKKMSSLAGCCAVVAMFVSAVAAGAVTTSGGERVPKALVIMLDGMRADTVDNGLAPNIKVLADGARVNRGSVDVAVELCDKAAPVSDGAVGGGLRLNGSSVPLTRTYTSFLTRLPPSTAFSNASSRSSGM